MSSTRLGVRSRWLVLAVALGLAGDLAVAGATVVSRTERRLTPNAAAHATSAVEGRAQPAVDRQRRRLIAALLARRAAAVRAHDRAGFLATIDPMAASSFLTAQRSVAAALDAVPLAAWTYQIDAASEHELSRERRLHYAGAPTWSPEVYLSYRIAGFDAAVTSDLLYPTFVQRSGRWFLGAEDDFADSGLHTQKGPWDFGALQTTRTKSALVIFHPGAHALAKLVAGEVDRAVPRVDAVWKRPWAHRVVVILPKSQTELEALVNEDGLDQIAAVATAESEQLPGGSESPAVGDRVLVNPSNFLELGPLGRRVVLTHEITHVATRSATSADAPSWLVEGFADYIGYLGAGVPVRVAAQELAKDLKAGRRLGSLPTEADFAASNTDLAQAYEKAWMANRLIAERIGPAGLAAFYAAVGRESPHAIDADEVVSAALESTLHLDLAGFTKAWREYVTRQLG